MPEILDFLPKTVGYNGRTYKLRIVYEEYLISVQYVSADFGILTATTSEERLLNQNLLYLFEFLENNKVFLYDGSANAVRYDTLYGVLGF